MKLFRSQEEKKRRRRRRGKIRRPRAAFPALLHSHSSLLTGISSMLLIAEILLSLIYGLKAYTWRRRAREKRSKLNSHIHCGIINESNRWVKQLISDNQIALRLSWIPFSLSFNLLHNRFFSRRQTRERGGKSFEITFPTKVISERLCNFKSCY